MNREMRKKRLAPLTPVKRLEFLYGELRTGRVEDLEKLVRVTIELEEARAAKASKSPIKGNGTGKVKK